MNDTNAGTTTVVSVLLADGWHRVVPGSFAVDTLEFAADADLDLPGFRFEEADTGSPYRPATLAGPLGSILAVRQVTSTARHPGEVARPPFRRRARLAQDAVGRPLPVRAG